MWDKDAWKESCRRNAHNFDSEISRLRSDYGDPLGLTHFQYREFWDHTRRIPAIFKESLFREDRERLWAAYSVSCEATEKARPRG